MTQALVIGYGSIGQRHTRLLAEAGCDVALVTQQQHLKHPSYTEVRAALDATDPDYIVIANQTAQHAGTVDLLVAEGFRAKLLVEKPLAHEPYTVPADVFEQFAVGYNLRFNPALNALRKRLKDSPLVAINARCGQHLSRWRPDRDFRKTYSASRAAGGGVLRDLSHELDYLLWLGGPWQRVASLGGELGVLNIDADEAWSVLMQLKECPLAALQLNYLDHPARRDIIVTTQTSTLFADLIAGTLTEDDKTEQFNLDGDQTYRLMHQAMLQDDTSSLCSAREAESVVELIDTIETAAKERKWISA